ncbi:SGNH/GDSL hydrolase family protein [Neobacillus cucumis]|uniref:SGNH/GDSL hydrolase family protein n=1 Tax=Neobacillus cucumis TaxID=1740721 RepID=UPI00203ACBE8|nr:SGNH/GDSL hydrolase family protein [Neobacillus cucumis]MCM3729090.1 SGNH/GDSL hydrolase family protein [Neobacillus cucumis]
MKTFFTILLGIACLTVVVWGHSNWNKKIAVASNHLSSFTQADGVSSQKITTGFDQEEIVAYTSNWPSTAVKTFKKAIKEKKAYKILFVGSPAIGSDTAGSYPSVKEKLIETFGKKNIQVKLKTFNSTSTKFISDNKQADLAAEKADVIVLEPFILLNNGEVLPENTLKDITKIMDDIKAKQPETTFILQPSYPLFQAKFYPNQVAVLKKFAEENKIAYLDHWTAWPDPNTNAFKDYLLPDGSAPSAKGYEVWSNYLIKYFTNQ